MTIIKDISNNYTNTNSSNELVTVSKLIAPSVQIQPIAPPTSLVQWLIKISQRTTAENVSVDVKDIEGL